MLQPPALAKAPGVLPLLVLALLGVAHQTAAGIGFTPIAMSNQPAPGFAAGTLYSPLCCTTGSSQFRLSESGAVAFTASTTALNRLGLPARGLWVRDETGSTSLVAGEGMPVPGAPGATYDGNVLQFEINASGHVAFGSPVIGGGPCCSNINALFGPDPGGGVRMVLRGGDPAPGIGGDATLSPLQMRIDINDSDEVAVSGLLRGPEITGANDSAVWTSDPSGPLVVRVREGDPAPGSGTFPHVSLNNYYRGSSVNDAG